MKANDFVALALRSPLHVVMGDTMLITVTGRKTGRKITLPVNYYGDGDSLWILSSRDRTWWRNVAGGGNVTLRLHGHDFKGAAEVILDEAVIAARMPAYARHIPGSAHAIGLRLENGVPNCDDLARLSKERLFVRVCIES